MRRCLNRSSAIHFRIADDRIVCIQSERHSRDRIDAVYHAVRDPMMAMMIILAYLRYDSQSSDARGIAVIISVCSTRSVRVDDFDDDNVS